MIDLKDLRANPDKYRQGAANKQMDAGLVDELLALDSELRTLTIEREQLTAEKNRIGKEIGQRAGQLKKAADDQRAQLQAEMATLQARPNEIKQREQELAKAISELEPKRDALHLRLPQPADADVPVGRDSTENVPLRTWEPAGWDAKKTFEENRGFEPLDHVTLMTKLDMLDFERGVKIAGSRSYILKGDGMKLHQAVLRYAFDFMTQHNGFTPVHVPVLVRDECMVGTGFFPDGKDQAYAIANPTSEQGMALTGTGEVGLMSLHMDELLSREQLPLCYTTVSTCFRREAGAAGKDTAGLYRIHQFDKVEQVVICEADKQVSRNWHKKMIGYVESLLQQLELPYRLLQCCTGDLGPKNADMIDIECWMPSRGDYGETHSASRLYDYQCRRLNMRYRDAETKQNIICHSLNNTVLASPRVLIPIVELYQNADGSITVPEVLRPYMAGQQRIG